VLVQPELTLGTPASGEGSLPAAASDGTQIALSFWSSSQSSMARGYLDSVGVAFTPSTSHDVGSVTTGKLWFDGKSYMLLESKAAAGSLGVRRFEPTLAPVDSAKAGSGYLIEPVFNPYAFVQVAAASNGAGKSLVAYPQLDPARLGGTIKVRLINNDGLKDPNASGAAGGAGGAGGNGRGGAADSGGTGLNGGTGGLNGGTGGLNGGAGRAGEGGLNAGGESTIEGGMPQAGGAGTGGDASTAGSSDGGTGQGGADAVVGGAETGGTPGTGGAVQAGTGGVSPQAGSGAVSGTAGSSASAGTTSGNNNASTDSGCGCRIVAPSRNGGHMPIAALAVLGVALGRIRRRRAGTSSGHAST